MPDGSTGRTPSSIRARTTFPARHESPAIDELAMVAARHADRMLAEAHARDATRWATFLAAVPDHLRDDELRELRGTAVRARAAYGPKDSIRDALPPDLTEPVLDALDRLIRELDRQRR
jgi:hypothetical protein